MPATFANQTSNISALTSKVKQLLEPTNGNNRIHDDTDRERSARNFLTVQTSRIHAIEDQFLSATKDILPSSSESKTITELAALCRLTQTVARQKLDLLKRRLQEGGYSVQSPPARYTHQTQDKPQPRQTASSSMSSPVSSNHRRNRNITSSPPQPSSSATLASSLSSPSWPLTTTIGGPLESVLEADVETDGATTPGSMLQSPPPMLWNSSKAKSGGSNHRTKSFASPTRSTVNSTSSPSMDRLTLSASTTHLLRQQQQSFAKHQNDDVPQPLSSSKHSHQRKFSTPSKTASNKQHHPQQQQQQQRPWNVEFREEDDMITLDTHSSMTKNSSPVRATGATKTIGTKVPKEDRSRFFARMEDMLDRVEEIILEDVSPRRFRGDEPSRPSDELHASLESYSRSSSRHHQPSLHSQDNDLQRTDRTRKTYEDESYFGSSDGSDEDEDDDSTNVAATLVADRDQSFQRGYQTSKVGASSRNLSGAAPIERATNRPHPLNYLQQRPSHILVDTAIPSPAHTNITMDATVMNETFASFLGVEENYFSDPVAPIQEDRDYHNGGGDDDDDTIGNLSTVTPVLDRYRLDPDDENSIGVKVVPNERGSHQKSSQRKMSASKHGTHPFITSLSRPKTPKQGEALPRFSASDFLSPKTTPISAVAGQRTPSSISTRTKKVYRKTPFLRRKARVDQEDGYLPTLNENDHPNTSTGSDVAASPEKFRHSTGPIEAISISVPPLRPRSLDSRRLDENFGASNTQPGSMSTFKKDRTESVALQRIDQEEAATLDQIDKTIERIDQELATGEENMEPVDLSSGRVDPVGKSFLNQVKSMSKNNNRSATKHGHTVKSITMAEFEAAPRNVRTQVSINEAN